MLGSIIGYCCRFVGYIMVCIVIIVYINILVSMSSEY